MMDIKIDETAGYIELTVDGAIDKAGYEAAVAAIEALLKTHRRSMRSRWCAALRAWSRASGGAT